MSIPVVCPQCSAKLNAPDSAAGKKVKCPKCQTAMVVPTPLPEEPAFEVMDDPEPSKKPVAAKPVVKPKVKADVTVDDDEEKPRKKRVPAEIEDDEKPRKKRQEESDEDEEDDRPRKKKKPAAGNSNMTRNIIGGVVLLVLLGVAGWVFYDKFGKKDDTAGNTSGGNPPGTIPTPGGQGGPNPPPIGPPGLPGGGNPVPQSAWVPDPNVVKELTQKGEVGPYQISLPQKFSAVQLPVKLPPQVEQGTWMAKTAGGEPPATLSVTVLSDPRIIGEAGKDMRQMLLNFSAGVASGARIDIANRGPTERGRVNDLEFTRFSFSGTGPKQIPVRGLVYGTVDQGRVVAVIAMGFGETAETEVKVLESVIATLTNR